jgi:hypothetical protein
MKKLFSLLALAAGVLLAAHTSVFSLGTLSATGTTIPVQLAVTAHKHTVQVVTTGSPTTCSIQLEGTLDDVTSSPTWANISGSQTCTSSVTFHIADRPVNGVRVNLTALSGGSSPTVAIKYVGVE